MNVLLIQILSSRKFAGVFSAYTRGHIPPDCMLRDVARVLEMNFSCE